MMFAINPRPIWMVGLLVAAVRLSLAAAPAEPARLIEKITIIDTRGRAVPETVSQLVRNALDNAGVREGRPYDRVAIRSADVALRPLVEQFLEAFDARTGELKIAVEERPVLEDIIVRGNRHYTTQEVLNFLEGVAIGGRVNRNLIADRLDNLRRKYREVNYYFAEADYDPVVLAERRVLVITISEGPRVRVRQITFEGLADVEAAPLYGEIETSVRIWPLVSGNLDDARLDNDVQKLTEYLQGLGYLNARVGRRLAFTNRERTDAEVIFVVREGPRFRVNDIRIRIEGSPDRPPGAGTAFTEAELRERLTNAPGKFYTRRRYEDDLTALRDAYGRVGRYRSSIDTPAFEQQPPVGKPEEGLIDFVLTIREAPQIRIGRIEVIENRDTKNTVILRVLRKYGIAPGEVYNTEALRLAREELEASGLFQPTRERPFGVLFEDFAPPVRDPADLEPGVRDLRVELNEGVTRLFSFGVGFNTNFGLIGNVSYLERNFDITELPDDLRELFSNFLPGRGDATGRAFTGNGERFLAEIRPGLERSNGRLSWRTPYFGNRDVSLGTDIYFQTRDFREYSELRFGGLISVGRQRLFGQDGLPVSGEIGLRPEIINISDLPDQAGEDLLDADSTFFEIYVPIQLALDRRERLGNDRTAAFTGGDVIALEAIPTIGSRTYSEFNVRYQRYFTVRTDVEGGRDVLSIGGRVGYIVGDVPVFDRFYGGGVGTFRGFSFRGVSPRDSFDNAIGGKFLVVTTADYSFPVLRFEGLNIRGFGFVDAGTVEDDVGFSNFRVSVGPGVRFVIPLLGPVPVELGVGFPIVKDGSDEREIFFANVGIGF